MPRAKAIEPTKDEGEPTVAELQAAVTAAERAAAAARVEVADARRAYDASLADPDASVSIAAHRRIADAEVAADRAAARVAPLEARLRAACERDAEETRVADYDRARRLQAEAVRQLTDIYPVAVETIVGILATIASADHAIAEANADLPARAERLEQPELLVRGWPALPEEVVEVRDGDCGWFDLHGNRIFHQSRCEPVDASGRIGKMRPAPVPQEALSQRAYDDRGYERMLAQPAAVLGPVLEDRLSAPIVRETDGPVVRRRKRVTTFLPPLAGREVPSLASRIVLPGLTFGAEDAWAGQGHWSDDADTARQLEKFAARSTVPLGDRRAAERQTKVREALIDEPELVAQARTLAGEHPNKGED